MSEITLDTSKLNRILKNLKRNTSAAVASVAFSVERKAKINAPVDTGALRSSIYTKMSARGGQFSEVSTAIQGHNKNTRSVELPEPPNDHTAYVGPSVDYGIDVELGTSRHAAQPFLLPAIRETEKELIAHFGKVATNG